jgi:hypothetical protein
MALSGTNTYRETRDQIIQSALENVGAIGPGDTRSANNSILFDVGSAALNRLIKELDALGYRLWHFVARTTTTTLGAASFALGADVLDVTDGEMNYMRAGQTTRTLLMPLSRQEYHALPDRTVTGLPNTYYVEKGVAPGVAVTVFLFPVPDATGDTIEYEVQVRSADMTSGADDYDASSKWGQALVDGLSALLAPKFRQYKAADYHRGLYEKALAFLINDDSERGNCLLSAGSSGGGTMT